jgi:prolyl-tRNA synthetase
MGTVVEVSHDEKGIIWPKNIAPYNVHLINLIVNSTRTADAVYKKLQDAHIEVLYDRRSDVSAGEKFADADLIGIPYRLVVSEKTGDRVEVKERSKEKTILLDLEEAIRIIKS